jgi:Fe-S-cluster-containing dehydrogenase component
MKTGHESQADAGRGAPEVRTSGEVGAAPSRREFFKILGTVGAVGAVGVNAAQAESAGGSVHESWGMLTDLTLCIGCRKCEFACKQSNGFSPQPIEAFEDKAVFEHPRRIGANDVTFVNRYGAAEGARSPLEASASSQPAGDAAAAREIYVKSQCMHCNHPACVSACPVAAIRKTAEGPVVYRARKCIGCRYCMMACPFSMLSYTYDDPFTPVVRKCSMCFDTIHREGGVPACVKICPVEAITFGKRGELVALARERIRNSPEKYVDHIYGEHEVGGTSVLYIGPKPFNEVGFRTDLGTTPLPDLTSRFMSIVPLVVTIWPALLTGIYTLTRRRLPHPPAGGIEAGEHTVRSGKDTVKGA